MQKGYTTFSFHERGFAPLILLVGMLVIIGVAGGAYFFGKSQVAKSQPSNPVIASQTPQITPTPASTPDETANWKTYSNNANGYSLRYPGDLLIETDKACNRLSGTDDNIMLFKNHGGQYQCSGGYEPLYFYVSTTTAYQDQVSKNNPCVTVTREPVIVGGLSASRITLISTNTKTEECGVNVKANEGFVKSVHTIVKTDKITFDFGYTVVVGGIPEDTLNKILSTFKFIN
ncbi:MAG: hypothetical protein Q7R82_01740 [Candidatus Daviesbacteria bacterium]|nr:hypothetical protein [Candidatus Daviesbacteria bacterium]